MKLELKHIAPYLPYELTFLFNGEIYPLDGLDVNMDAFNADFGEVPIDFIKPILRPISGLNAFLNEIRKNTIIESWEDDWLDHISDFSFKIQEANILACPYTLIEILFLNHFDVFGLIEKGIAIDINTI